MHLNVFFLYEETNFMMDSFISVGPVYKLAGIVLTGQKTEAVVWRCSVEKMFLEISQNSQENTCARVSFLIKLQALGLQIYLKRDSGTGVFLSVLQTPFLQNTPGRLLLKKVHLSFLMN